MLASTFTRPAVLHQIDTLQQQDRFLGLEGPMEAETMSLPPMKEYRRRLGVPGLALERSRVPFVAAAIRVLLTCKHLSP